MSDNGILQKFVSRVPEGATDIREGEAEDLGGFGFLRGVRDRSLMIEFRKKQGQVLAVNCSFICKMEYDPAAGIALHTAGGQIVRIAGRNLNAEAKASMRLFEGLTRFKVPWIQEADRADTLGADEDTVIVESIDW